MVQQDGYPELRVLLDALDSDLGAVDIRVLSTGAAALGIDLVCGAASDDAAWGSFDDDLRGGGGAGGLGVARRRPLSRAGAATQDRS